jgi:lipopolysaccharide export system protein LptA
VRRVATAGAVVLALLLSLAPDPGGAQPAQRKRAAPPAAAPAAPAEKPRAAEAAPTKKGDGKADNKKGDGKADNKKGDAKADNKKGDTKADKSAPVTVDADQLESLQKEGLIIFTGNVVAKQDNSTQHADRMEVYLDAGGDRIVRTISTGSVRIITKDCKMGTARRAEYYDAEQRVILIGNARVWQDDNVVTGERITIYLAEDRSVVEAGRQERVKAVFYPKKDDGKAEAKPTRAPGAPCS